jgi:hypothetical protein
VIAPPAGWWRMSDGGCRRRGQATVAVRKGGVEGDGWLATAWR